MTSSLPQNLQMGGGGGGGGGRRFLSNTVWSHGGEEKGDKPHAMLQSKSCREKVETAGSHNTPGGRGEKTPLPFLLLSQGGKGGEGVPMPRLSPRGVTYCFQSS